MSSSNNTTSTCFLKRGLSSSSSTSAPSPFSQSQLPQNIIPRPTPTPPLEDHVWNWKDISLSSLNVDHPAPSPSINLNNHPTFTFTFTFPSRYASPSPATFLTLNPGPDSSETTSSQHVSDSGLLQGFAGYAAAVNVTEKRRSLDPSSYSSDQRHKRMMKNRESAARSRARKQAYMNELELEVENLMKENAKLKEQQKQMRLAAAAQQSRKHSLQRTFTAPF